MSVIEKNTHHQECRTFLNKCVPTLVTDRSLNKHWQVEQNFVFQMLVANFKFELSANSTNITMIVSYFLTAK